MQKHYILSNEQNTNVNEMSLCNLLKVWDQIYF